MTVEKTYQFPFVEDKVHEYILENGHKIITIRKPGDITNICTWIKTGSINEDDINNGVSHFLEHLMFKGTERLKPGEFDKMLESRGGIINAATWKDYTFYYITIPNGENDENYKLAIDLHADMLLNSTLPEEEIGAPYNLQDSLIKEKRERSVVIEEISMREDQPWTKTYNTLNEMMYSTHPYKRDTIGTREIIASIPRDEIIEYYQKWYVPENTITVIISDHEHADMMTLVKKHFAFKAVNKSPESIYESEKPTTETKYKNIFGDVTTGYGIIGFHGPKPSELKDTICIHIASIVLGDGRSCRLIQNLIEKPADPIFNIVSCTVYQFRDGNNIFIHSNFKADKKDEAIKQLFEEINQLQTKPISNEELNKARKKLKSSFAETAETASNIAEAVGHTIVLTGDISNYIKYLDILEKITINDVQESINKYMNPNNAYVSTLTPCN